MKRVQKSVLLWYSAEQMYRLVTDVEAYPRFLPWCAKAEVLERDEQGSLARLHLAYAGVKHAFTTRNVEVHGSSLSMKLVDGPFSMLDGLWLFTPLGGASANHSSAGGSLSPEGCRVEFDLRYAFNSRALEAVVSPVFDRIAATFVDAFVQQAEVVHGPR